MSRGVEQRGPLCSSTAESGSRRMPRSRPNCVAFVPVPFDMDAGEEGGGKKGIESWNGGKMKKRRELAGVPGSARMVANPRNGDVLGCGRAASNEQRGREKPEALQLFQGQNWAKLGDRR